MARVAPAKLPPPLEWPEPDGTEPQALVLFLNLLIREVVPAREVERLVVHVEGVRRDRRLDQWLDGPLADFAAQAARRILGPPEEPGEADPPADADAD